MDEERFIPSVCCYGCDTIAVRTRTKYGIRDRCPSCGKHSWGGKPLVSQDTHDARQLAHEVFDKLWRNGPDRVCHRTEAYLMLAEEMGYKPGECHIAQMGKDEARRVPIAVRAVRDRLQADGRE